MIRFAWVALVLVLSTLFFGTLVILASLLRIRGPIYSWATQSWSRVMLWVSSTPVIMHGAEHVNWDEPQVLVSNHMAGYDIFALAAVVPSSFHFVAKKELERIPFFGMAWKAAGHISIDRSNRAMAIASLRRAADKIRREKGTVIIFPEGTRSRTGQLLPFKKGAFLLAVEAGVPVVPAVLVGSEQIFDSRRFRIRPRPIHLYFAPPMHPADHPSESVDQLIERVRAAMNDLLEAGRRKEGATGS